MSRNLVRLLRRLHLCRSRRVRRLDPAKAALLRANLRMLLFTKESLAERRESAA